MLRTLAVFLVFVALVQSLTLRSFSGQSGCSGVPTSITVVPNATCVQQSFTYYRYVLNADSTTLTVCTSFSPTCASCSSTVTYSNLTSCSASMVTFSATDDIFPNNFVVQRYRVSSSCASAFSGLMIGTAPTCSSSSRTECKLGFRVASQCNATCSVGSCVYWYHNILSSCNLNGVSYSETCGGDSYGTCSVASIQRAIDEFNDVINEPRTSPQSASYTFYNLFSSALNGFLSPCTARLNAIRSGTVTQTTTVMSDTCTPLNASSSDPCCNPLLRQCCMPRSTQVTTVLPVYDFGNCSVVSRARPLYLTYNKLITAINNNYSPSTQFSEEDRTANSIMRCFTHVSNQANTYCNADSACKYSGKCLNNYCVPPSNLVELSNHMATCILTDGFADPSNPISSAMRALFLRSLNLPVDTSVAALASYIQNNFALQTGSCFSASIGSYTPPQFLTNMNSCRDQNAQCNDNTIPIGSCVNNFCGFCYDALNSSCTASSQANLTETDCADQVYCNNAGSGAWMHRTNCIVGTGSCGNAPCGSNITSSTQCQSVGRCSSNYNCASPNTYCYVNTMLQCSSGSVNGTSYFCYKSYADCICYKPSFIAWTSDQCASIGGSVRDSNDRATCESFKYCQYSRGSTTYQLNLPADQCTACGGTLFNAHYFYQGYWTTTSVSFTGKLYQRNVQRRYSWITPGFDYNKMNNAIISALAGPSARSILALYRRMYFAPFELLKRVACDCDANRGQTNCFTNPIKFALATVTALPGATQTFNLGDLTVTVKPNSFNSGRGSEVALGLSRTHVGFDISTARQALLPDVYVEENGKNIGQIIGHGASLDTSADGPVTLCLSLEPGIGIAGTYNTPNFAIFTNGKYSKTSLAVSVQNNQYCADVSDTQTYYPARVESAPVPPSPPTPQPTPKPAPQTSKKNDATPVSINGLVSLVLMVLVCFIML